MAARRIEQAPAITRLLDKLEAKGLIRRERSRKDRPQALCWIEPQGLALPEQLGRPVLEAKDRLMGCLSPEEWRVLLDILTKLLAEERHLAG